MTLFIGKAKYLQELKNITSGVMRQMRRDNRYLLFHADEVTVIDLDEIRKIEPVAQVQDELGESFCLIITTIEGKVITVYFDSEQDAEEIREDVVNHLKDHCGYISYNESRRELERMRLAINNTREVSGE